MSQFTIYTRQTSDDYAEFTTNDTSRLQSFQNFAYFHSKATPEKKIEKIFEEYFIDHSDFKLKLPYYEEDDNNGLFHQYVMCEENLIHTCSSTMDCGGCHLPIVCDIIGENSLCSCIRKDSLGIRTMIY